MNLKHKIDQLHATKRNASSLMNTKIRELLASQAEVLNIKLRQREFEEDAKIKKMTEVHNQRVKHLEASHLCAIKRIDYQHHLEVSSLKRKIDELAPKASPLSGQVAEP